MRIYTIGFTKKSAEHFFTLLKENGVRCLIDIRRHPNGQLAGFSKQDDLPYFLDRLAGGCEYLHLPVLAPSEELLSDYRGKRLPWSRYAERFEALMDERNIPGALDRLLFEEKVCCLLCSEDKPDKCHRRIVAERLAKHWGDVEIVHLV